MELSDDELEAKLVELVTAEREGLMEFLTHLADFDRRRVANKKAYPSTFEYCMVKLQLSADEAFRRIRVARYGRENPSIIEMIGDGRLSLTAATRLVAALRDGAPGDVLESAAGKTVKEVEVLLARLKPVAEPPRDVIRPIALAAEPASPGAAASPGAPAPLPPPPAPPRLAYRVSITLSDAGYEMLCRATDLLRHKHPQGEPHAIVEEALDALLDAVDRGRKDKPARPRPGRAGRPGALGAPAAPAATGASDAPGAGGGRYIPEWVKDAVWKRDAGRCAFISREGWRCETTAFLQFDHETPFALGGASDDPRNVRLLCAAHNRQAAADAGLRAGPPPPGPLELRLPLDGEREC